MVASKTIGLFGKIPAERDFVRVNSGSFQRAGLDQWFQEGIAQLQGERTRLPEEPACFLLFAANGEQPFVGVLAPGFDAVGRAFPIIVSAALEGRPERDTLSTLPLRLESFFQAGCALAVSSQQLGAAPLAAEVTTLASSVQPAMSVEREELLAQTRLSELHAALDGVRDAAAYALTTVLTACAHARAAQGKSPSRVLTLDCPAASAGLRAFWLEIVLRHMGPEMPSLFWTQSGRMLIALGPAPSLLLAYLGNSEHKSSRRWPLRTLNSTAIATAVEKLSRAQAQVLGSGDASLAEVLSAFSAG